MARKKRNTHTNSYSPNTSDCNFCLGTECSQKRAFNWKLNQLLCPSKNECVSSFAFAIKKVIEFRHFFSFENQLRIGIASRSRETHARAAPVFALFVSTTSVCCYNALVHMPLENVWHFISSLNSFVGPLSCSVSLSNKSDLERKGRKLIYNL